MIVASDRKLWPRLRHVYDWPVCRNWKHKTSAPKRLSRRLSQAVVDVGDEDNGGPATVEQKLPRAPSQRWICGVDVVAGTFVTFMHVSEDRAADNWRLLVLHHTTNRRQYIDDCRWRVVIIIIVQPVRATAIFRPTVTHWGLAYMYARMHFFLRKRAI